MSNVDSNLNEKTETILQNVTFNGTEHKKFFAEYLPKCRYVDVYHIALIYCLGISADTRNHINSIYEFKTGFILPECLSEAWITSGSAKVVRMAFNLYCGGTPRLEECRNYTVDELFCCGYAKYFWEAVKLRYPEYCS